jgi:hypothetical protein
MDTPALLEGSGRSRGAHKQPCRDLRRSYSRFGFRAPSDTARPHCPATNAKTPPGASPDRVRASCLSQESVHESSTIPPRRTSKQLGSLTLSSIAPATEKPVHGRSQFSVPARGKRVCVDSAERVRTSRRGRRDSARSNGSPPGTVASMQFSWVIDAVRPHTS